MFWRAPAAAGSRPGSAAGPAPRRRASAVTAPSRSRDSTSPRPATPPEYRPPAATSRRSPAAPGSPPAPSSCHRRALAPERGVLRLTLLLGLPHLRERGLCLRAHPGGLLVEHVPDRLLLRDLAELVLRQLTVVVAAPCGERGPLRRDARELMRERVDLRGDAAFVTFVAAAYSACPDRPAPGCTGVGVALGDRLVLLALSLLGGGELRHRELRPQRRVGAALSEAERLSLSGLAGHQFGDCLRGAGSRTFVSRTGTTERTGAGDPSWSTCCGLALR
jgi:hypothetical protein